MLGRGSGGPRVQGPSSTPFKGNERKLLTSSWTRFLSIIGKYANERPTWSERGKSSSKRATGETSSSPGSPGTARAPPRAALAGRQPRLGLGAWPQGSGRRPGSPPPPPRPRGSGLSAPRCCRFRRRFRRRLQACWSAGSPRRGARRPPQPPLAPRRGEATRRRILCGAPAAPDRAAGFVTRDPTARGPCIWRQRQHCSGGSPAGPPVRRRALAMHQRGRRALRASSGRPGSPVESCTRALLR